MQQTRTTTVNGECTTIVLIQPPFKSLLSMASLWSYPLLLRGRTTNRTHTYPINELNIDLTVFKVIHFYHYMTVVIIALSLMTQSGCHIFTSLSTLLPFLAVSQKYNNCAMNFIAQCNGRQYMRKCHWFYQENGEL